MTRQRIYGIRERLSLRYQIAKAKLKIISLDIVEAHLYLYDGIFNEGSKEEREYFDRISSLKKRKRRFFGRQAHLESLLDISRQKYLTQRELEKEAKLFAG